MTEQGVSGQNGATEGDTWRQITGDRDNGSASPELVAQSTIDGSSPEHVAGRRRRLSPHVA
jgi:hypothetical protein